MKDVLTRIAAALEKLVSYLESNDEQDRAKKGGITRALTAERDEKGHFKPRESQPAGDNWPRGVHPELKSIDGSELLKDARIDVQASWIKAFTLPLIQRELPTIAAKWSTDEVRQQCGNFNLYLVRWLQRVQRLPSLNAPGKEIASSSSVVTEREAERTRRQINENLKVRPTSKMLEEIRRLNGKGSSS